MVQLTVCQDRVCFQGPTGQHSIDISVSSAERIAAHLDGFVVEVARKLGCDAKQAMQRYRTRPTDRHWEMLLEAIESHMSVRGLGLTEAELVKGKGLQHGDLIRRDTQVFRVIRGERKLRTQRFNRARHCFNAAPVRLCVAFGIPAWVGRIRGL